MRYIAYTFSNKIERKRKTEEEFFLTKMKERKLMFTIFFVEKHFFSSRFRFYFPSFVHCRQSTHHCNFIATRN